MDQLVYIVQVNFHSATVGVVYLASPVDMVNLAIKFAKTKRTGNAWN